MSGLGCKAGSRERSEETKAVVQARAGEVNYSGSSETGWKGGDMRAIKEMEWPGLEMKLQVCDLAEKGKISKVTSVIPAL